MILKLLRETPEEKILKLLNNPKDIGVPKLARHEIYEDLR